jgi:hypothetical protein
LQREPTQLEKLHWRRSWRWSAGLHVCLATLLIVEMLWFPLPFFAAATAARPLILVEQRAMDAQPLEVEMQLDERPWIARDAEGATYIQVDLTDPRWDDILSEPFRRAEGIEASPADAAAGVLVSAELLRAIEASGRRSEEENLRSLERLSGRLTKVSSEETLDELSGTIGRLVGTGPRETKPKENVAGTFDHSTGQPHDCKKVEVDGKVRYVMVMIDKAGRTQEVEMSAADGEQLYQTMQLIKSNPLLERVYRGVVMGIMDKLLAPQPPK